MMRGSLEEEICILKEEISLLKEMCQDLRATLAKQDQIKKEKQKDLPKTIESQEIEICLERDDCGKHKWRKIFHSGRDPRIYWECEVCREEKMGSVHYLFK